MSIEFLLTSLLVVASPGIGVIFTIAAGLSRGARASIVAAFACTIGIVPHMLAAITGLAAILHTSALAPARRGLLHQEHQLAERARRQALEVAAQRGRGGGDPGGVGLGHPRGRGGAGRGAGAARRRDQAKLSLSRTSPGATRHCHNYRFKLAKAHFLHFQGVNAPFGSRL